MTRYLISACLLGQKVRYDGRDCLVKAILDHVMPKQYVAICPEVAGGLSIPRPAAEIQLGDGHDVLAGQAQVMTRDQHNVSQAFIHGAYAALSLAQQHGITHAILKSNSPSCGYSTIYDGSFSGQKRLGDGVTAALLKQHGITVLTEQAFLDLLKSTDPLVNTTSF